jgi:hypothetical protein
MHVKSFVLKPTMNTAWSCLILIVSVALIFVINVSHLIEFSDIISPSTDPQKSLILSSDSNSSSQTSTRKAVIPNSSKAARYMTIPKRKKGIVKDLVKPGDFVYYKATDLFWDSSPIVIESHKLLFFSIPKVGCTVWKQLFRKMMGIEDWKSQDYENFLPHNPDVNGLKYLYDYSIEEASIMLSSPEWTRAMMVRDPKIRFLSAFIDKSVSNDHAHIINRCCPDRSCVDEAQTITGFLKLAQRCDDEHWRSQADRVDYHIWPYMDEILHVENAAADSERLLRKIGAWEEYGASGWGDDGQLAIFGTKEQSGAGIHAQYAEWQVWKYYTPESEKAVEKYYQQDYDHPLFNFTRGQCLTCQV